MKNNELDLLPEIKRQSGATFYLQQRSQKTALYKRVSDEGIVTYLVVKIIIVPATSFKGMNKRRREKFPGLNDGGIICWDIYTLEGALKKYYELEKRQG